MSSIDRNRTGILFFVGSESFFFLSLMIAFGYYALPRSDLSVKYLEVGRTLIFTVFLIASSFTLYFSEKMMKKGNHRMQLIFLMITFLFGLTFIYGQGSEYARLFRVNMNISSGVFGTTFFTLTGFHGLHVIIGLFMLMMIGLMTASGVYRKIEHVYYGSVSVYWHFVDVVWIFVFTLSYLIPLFLK